MMDKEQLAVEKYKLLVELWMSENPIKTNKLQMLMATNSILVTAFSLVERPLLIASVGFLFALVWVFSIGRTLSYQRHWQSQMEQLRQENISNSLFQIHSEEVKATVFGMISSKWYLLGTPIVTALAWFCVMLYVWIAKQF